jgi:hypothetical protein
MFGSRQVLSKLANGIGIGPNVWLIGFDSGPSQLSDETSL